MEKGSHSLILKFSLFLTQTLNINEDYINSSDEGPELLEYSQT